MPTKRSVLSRTARLFDPLGWLAPIIIRAKLLVQTAWLQHLDWDAPLADGNAATWIRLEEELPLLESVRLPRGFGHGHRTTALELHGFADASELAYAAVVYLRAGDAASPSVSLVAARTKVAPLKRVSLPRLELCAASLLAGLAEHIRATLTCNLQRFTFGPTPLSRWDGCAVTQRNGAPTWQIASARSSAPIRTQPGATCLAEKTPPTALPEGCHPE